VQLTGVCTSDTGNIDQTMVASQERKKACENALPTLKNFKDESIVREHVGYFVTSEKHADKSIMDEVEGETVIALLNGGSILTIDRKDSKTRELRGTSRSRILRR
jgi:hypothetical protein